MFVACGRGQGVLLRWGILLLRKALGWRRWVFVGRQRLRRASVADYRTLKKMGQARVARPIFCQQLSGNRCTIWACIARKSALDRRACRTVACPARNLVEVNSPASSRYRERGRRLFSGGRGSSLTEIVSSCSPRSTFSFTVEPIFEPATFRASSVEW